MSRVQATPAATNTMPDRRVAGEQRGHAESDHHDRRERPAQEDDGHEVHGSPGAPTPQLTARQEEEQRGDRLRVEVEADGGQGAGVNDGDEQHDRGDGDGGRSPELFRLEEFEDPEIGDEAAAGDGEILDTQKGDRLREHSKSALTNGTPYPGPRRNTVSNGFKSPWAMRVQAWLYVAKSSERKKWR